MAHQLVYVVAVYGVTLTGLFLFSGMPRTWSSMLSWDNVWAVTVGPLYAVLLGTTITAMELRNRGGGTWWRPVPESLARGARVAVLVAHVIAANVLALIVPLIGCGLGGFTGPTPWRTVLTLAAVCGLSQSALAVGAVVMARIFNPAAALVVGSCFAMSWMVVGTVESDTWRLWPANWLVRGTMPLTGTHANGVGLAPGDPLWSLAQWEPALLSLGLAAVLASFEPRPATQIIGRLRSRFAPHADHTDHVDGARELANNQLAGRATNQRTTPTSAREQTRTRAGHASVAHGVRAPRPALALLAVVARTLVPWIPVMLFAFGLLLLRWRSARDVAMLEAVIMVPLSASILPIALWTALSPGWRAIGTRPTRFTRPTVIALTASVAWSSILIALVMALLSWHGLDPAKAARGWWCCTVATAFITTLVGWAAARFGPAVAGAVSVFGVIFGTLIGATGLLATLWPFVPWSWGALYAAAPIAITTLVTAVTAPFFARRAGTASIRACAAD